MPDKRYKDVISLTIRIPPQLHRRAVELKRYLEDRGIELEIPDHPEPVKPSLAVFALRGLEREIEELEKKKGEK